MRRENCCAQLYTNGLIRPLGTIGQPGYHRHMCARARLSSDVSEIKLAFSTPPERPAPNFAASWNVAPTDPLPVVRYDTLDGQRSLDVMRWGLIPYWAKDIKIGFSTINARAEDIDTKPAFREAFRQRRCLVPLDSFYEWAKTPTGKQPYAIGLKGGGLMAMAGLWGDLALARGRTDPQLHDRHYDAERIVRQAPQPDARGIEARGVADVARRGAGRSAGCKGFAGPLPLRRHDLLAGQRACRQCQKQRSVADRAHYPAVILPWIACSLGPRFLLFHPHATTSPSQENHEPSFADYHMQTLRHLRPCLCSPLQIPDLETRPIRSIRVARHPRL
jgi:SOS response associated peptidase (SRAP)